MDGNSQENLLRRIRELELQNASLTEEVTKLRNVPHCVSLCVCASHPVLLPGHTVGGEATAHKLLASTLPHAADRCVLMGSDGIPFTHSAPIPVEETSLGVYIAKNASQSRILSEFLHPVQNPNRQCSDQPAMTDAARLMMCQNAVTVHLISHFLVTDDVMKLAATCQATMLLLLNWPEAPWSLRNMKTMVWPPLYASPSAALPGLGAPNYMMNDVVALGQAPLPRLLALRCAVGWARGADSLAGLLQPFYCEVNCETEKFRCVTGSILIEDIAPGDQIDVLDSVNKWYDATVIGVRRGLTAISVHYNNWGNRWDEVLPCNSVRLAAYRSKYDPATAPYGDPLMCANLRIGWIGGLSSQDVAWDPRQLAQQMFPEQELQLNSYEAFVRDGADPSVQALMESRFVDPRVFCFAFACSQCFVITTRADKGQFLGNHNSTSLVEMRSLSPVVPGSQVGAAPKKIHSFLLFLREDGCVCALHRWGREKTKY